jgi:ABC-type sugar transport system, periplasmic component
MKKSLKRLICISIAALMLLSLAACGGNNGSNGQEQTTAANTTQAATTAAATTKALDPVQLTYYLVFNAAQPDQDEVFAAVNKITQEKINTTINFKEVDYASYADKIKVVLGAGDDCDICWTSSWLNNYNQNVAMGAYADITDLLNQYGQGMLKDIPSFVWDALKVNGKIYGIPSYQISTYAQGLTIRKDLADKYSFDTTKVKHVADLEPLLKACKAGGDQVYVPGTALWNVGVEWEANFEEISIKAPGAINDDDSTCKVFNQWKTPEFTNFLKMARAWNLAGYIRKDAISIDNDPVADFKAGKYVVSMGGNLAYDGSLAASAKFSYGYDWYEARLTDPIFQTSSITATINSITARCKNPDRAVMFEELLNTNTDLLNLLAFGVENKHYTKVSDGVISIATDSKYNTGWFWSIGNNFKRYIIAPDTLEANQKTLDTHAKAKGSPLLGFIFDSTPVLDQIAQCKSVYDEYFRALQVGAVDPDKTYPEFIDKLEKAGASTIIAEEQKQIDAWLATKK